MPAIVVSSGGVIVVIRSKGSDRYAKVVFVSESVISDGLFPVLGLNCFSSLPAVS